MPEGPEIFLAAREVNEAIAKKAVKVQFLDPRASPKLSRWPKNVKINRVYARSKAMLTEFSHGDVLYSHNQLYGQWVVHRKAQPFLQKQIRLIFETQSARVVLYSATDFAWLKLGLEDEHPYLSKLGPEVLLPEVTAKQIVDRLRLFPKRVIADALLNQQVLAGLGNYLRADILFVAKVNPLLKIGQLTPKQLLSVGKAAKRLTLRSVKQIGVLRPMGDYRRAVDQGLGYEQARFFTFDRQGSPCWICNAAIARVEQGGRGLFYCPSCQS
jgi:endonuclease VIII